MKLLVNIFQVIAIIAMIYPVYYIWDKDQVDNFCEELESGVSKQNMIDLAKQRNVTMQGPVDEGVKGGKWQASISPAVSSSHICIVKGVGSKIVSAKIAY